MTPGVLRNIPRGQGWAPRAAAESHVFVSPAMRTHLSDVSCRPVMLENVATFAP